MKEIKKRTKKIIYLIVILLLIISISIFTIIKTYNDKSTKISKSNNEIEMSNTIEEASSTTDKNINEIKENKIALNTENVLSTESSNIKSNKKEESKVKKENNTEKKKEIKFEKPIEGTIIKEFAKDNLLYSNTLNEWTTHLGIDIKANKTTVVKSAYEGTVESIKNDPRYGLTVIIEHDEGFKTVYSNLLTAEFVVEGEKVSKGQTIGTVGNTATFEIGDESHLHFEILKDNVQEDPTIYINY